MQFKQQYLGILALWGVVSTQSALAADEPLPLPLFDATYGIYAFGMQVAEGGRHLRALDAAHSHYEFYTSAKAVGVAALIRDDQITETSAWHWKNGGIQAEKYYFLKQSGEKRRFRQAVFDWNNKRVQSWKDEQQWDLPLLAEQQPVLDKLLVQLALMRDLQAHKDVSQQAYWIVDNEAILPYRVEAVGEENVDVPAGEFKTVKLHHRSARNPKRYSHLWCAPKLRYLPVKIEHTEPNGDTVSIRLLKVNGL